MFLPPGSEGARAGAHWRLATAPRGTASRRVRAIRRVPYRAISWVRCVAWGHGCVDDTMPKSGSGSATRGRVPVRERCRAKTPDRYYVGT